MSVIMQPGRLYHDTNPHQMLWDPNYLINTELILNCTFHVSMKVFLISVIILIFLANVMGAEKVGCQTGLTHISLFDMRYIRERGMAANNIAKYSISYKIYARFVVIIWRIPVTCYPYFRGCFTGTEGYGGYRSLHYKNPTEIVVVCICIYIHLWYR